MPRWKIGIDCRLAGLAHAGIGRYTAELVRELLHLGLQDKTQWVFFCRDSAQAAELLLEAPSQASYEVLLAPIQQYSVAEQLKLPSIFAEAELDLLHVPHFNVPLFYTGKTVITIHDLLWHEQRGSQVTTLSPATYWLKYFAYTVVTRQAIAKAIRIFVPTQHVAHSVAEWYPTAAPKTQVTLEGASRHLSAPQTKRVTKQLLYVGSLYPHKNIDVVLQALQQQPEWQLQIVGARSVFLERTEQLVAEYGVQDQVEFTGKVSDQELAQAYRSCTAVIQPSHSEGFGLTGLEAIALGAPLIASDIPVFHEVYQDAAVYFDQHSATALVTTLQQFDPEAQQFSSTVQQAVLSQFSWKRMAAETYATYQNVLT